jgi:hypothetical protein
MLPPSEFGLQVHEMHSPALPYPRDERFAPRGVAGLALRVRVWWQASDLDRRLAEGDDPSRCPELSLRVAQLMKAQCRERFASELESVVAVARSGHCGINDCVPLRRAEVVDSVDDLLALAAALRSPAPCRPYAAGTVSFLLRDAQSPLYYASAHTTPAQLARAATAGFTRGLTEVRGPGRPR